MKRSRAGTSGVVAVVVALAVTEFLAGLLPGGESLFIAVGNRVIELTPGPVVRFAIDTFASANRTVLFSGMVAGMVAAGAGIGIVGSRNRWLGRLGFVVFGLLGALAGVSDGALNPMTAVVATATGTLAGIWTLNGFRQLHDVDATEGVGGVSPADGLTPRRTFLAWTAAAAGGAAVLLTAGRFLQQRTATAVAQSTARLPSRWATPPKPPSGTTLDVDGISELFTPREEFYRIDTAFTIPRVDPATHRIRITGLVDEPYEITYADLVDRATTEADVTLSCVSNEVGGDLVGNARWLGVPLSQLLDRAGVQARADQIVGRSVDGWTSGFPVSAAYDGRPALVAVGMNGEPLPARHGFPVRLVIAGLYGYVSDTKWLSEIELTTFDAFDAYWVPRGWSAMGPIKTQSRIDVPRPGAPVAAGTVAVAGVAWSDERGVSGVEVSVDDGPWEPAELADELAATAWRQWVYRWEAVPGSHSLRVRASDGAGVVQTAAVAPPAPDGATGYHRVTVDVD